MNNNRGLESKWGFDLWKLDWIFLNTVFLIFFFACYAFHSGANPFGQSFLLVNFIINFIFSLHLQYFPWIGSWSWVQSDLYCPFFLIEPILTNIVIIFILPLFFNCPSFLTDPLFLLTLSICTVLFYNIFFPAYFSSFFVIFLLFFLSASFVLSIFFYVLQVVCLGPSSLLVPFFVFYLLLITSE